MKKQPETQLEVIATPFTEVITKSGLDISKAEKYALGYQPLMAEVLTQADLLKGLDKTKPDDAKIAKRVSLDLGKICSRLTVKKKEDKDTLLIETRLIDGLFNVAESTARLTQKDADEIVDYLENIERERKNKLADERREELQKYSANTDYLPLDIMGDEQYQRCLEDAKLAFEARMIAAEKAEFERLEQIKQEELAEAERLRLQAERIEAERLEAIRVREELEAKEQQLVKERQLAAAKSKRLAKENEKKLAEQKRLADIESARKEKIAAEQLAEKQKQNNRQSAMFSLGLKWDGQMFHYKDINFHWTDLLCMSDADFDKNLKGANKRMAILLAEELKKEQELEAESSRLKQELQAKKDAEEKQRKAFEAQAKADEEKRTASLRAPDKEKVRTLFEAIKSITIPEFGTLEGKAVGQMVLGALKVLQADIINESKKLL